MLSKRLYKIMHILFKVSNFLAVSNIKFNNQNLLFHRDLTDVNLVRRMLINFVLIIFWCFGSLYKMFYHYQRQDVNSTNLALAFFFGVICLVTTLSFTVFYGLEACQGFNGHNTFFRYLHRKYFNISINLFTDYTRV